jgi:phosphotransferase system HPr (HPr) family protein
MQDQEKTFYFKVISENGIHARPASIIVAEALKYQSDIKIMK